jgi:hypothetical protein
MAKKKYFPNNWQAFKDQPAEFYYQIPYDEFMDWKMAGWELPSSIACIIREQDLKTGKVKEYAYNTLRGANKRAAKIMKESKSEFLVCTHDDIGHMFPRKLTREDSIYDENQDGLEYREIEDDELPF